MGTEISGVSNWRLTVRREKEWITILRAVTCDEEAALPETLFGLPVAVLDSHALAADERTVQGEAAVITGAPRQSDWDNHNLHTLSLPRTLRRVGHYAFLNCGRLHSLSMFDNIEMWGGGVFMNCRALDTFRLVREQSQQGETLFYLNDVLTRELDITVIEADGCTARLIFPEYIETYEENCPAHHFDLRIHGAGYPYHHCFNQKRFDYAAYDRLWPDFLRIEHEENTALRLAWHRLRCPVKLSEAAQTQYLDYLQTHTSEIMRWLLSAQDAEGLRLLLRQTTPEPALLAEGCKLAREQGNTQAVALLLEEQHRRAPAIKTFDL